MDSRSLVNQILHCFLLNELILYVQNAQIITMIPFGVSLLWELQKEQSQVPVIMSGWLNTKDECTSHGHDDIAMQLIYMSIYNKAYTHAHNE